MEFKTYEGNYGTYHCEATETQAFEPTIWPVSSTTMVIENRWPKHPGASLFIPFSLQSEPEHHFRSRTYTNLQPEMLDADEMHELLPEHAKIMTPAPELGEGMFAISAHLGECRQPNIFCVNGERRMEGATGLTNLEKIIYYEAVMTGQGEPCLPHEDHSKRAWYKYAGGIKAKFKCTIDQAEEMAEAFRILDTTPKMAKTFDRWIAKKGFDAGLRYFRNLASQLVLVTDEGEPVLDMIEYSTDNDPDCVETDRTISAETWHKLDDPRDDETLWEDRQPKIFRDTLAKIRTADLPQLKAIGKALFNDKRFTKTQTTVIWDEYNRRKRNISPRLSKLALKALARLADPNCNLKAVAAWLYKDGQKKLTKHDQEVVWAAWHKLQPKKQSSPVPVQDDLPLDDYYPAE